jgi:hypothetical protein
MIRARPNEPSPQSATRQRRIARNTGARPVGEAGVHLQGTILFGEAVEYAEHADPLAGGHITGGINRPFLDRVP